ncbi:MAG: hypothetical protein ACI9TV_001875 [Sulfurimonas sp.]|jgi:hypothetical protein
MEDIVLIYLIFLCLPCIRAKKYLVEIVMSFVQIAILNSFETSYNSGIKNKGI